MSLSSRTQILEAAQAIKRGQLVVMPTETVYGLAGNALNKDALNAIFSAKKRPRHNPLIAHIHSLEMLSSLTSEYKLVLPYAEAFWPGPLTLVVNKIAGVPLELTGNLDTIAIRFPNHQVALALIEASGCPIAAPSANLYTKTSPTHVDHLSAEIVAAVFSVLDGGQCQVGIESTVLDLTQNEPKVLRLGPISAKQISLKLNRSIEYSTENLKASPGNHAVHYAPKTKLLIVQELPKDKIGIGIYSSGLQIIQLPNEPSEYGRLLYGAIHQLDALGLEQIYLEAPPKTTIWDAIWDRLNRASH